MEVRQPFPAKTWFNWVCCHSINHAKVQEATGYRTTHVFLEFAAPGRELTPRDRDEMSTSNTSMIIIITQQFG